jgi:uncharacterized protein
MKAKVINDAPERTVGLVLDRGDEVVEQLEHSATEHELSASRISAIGAFERAVLGYLEFERKEYERIPVD